MVLSGNNFLVWINKVLVPNVTSTNLSMSNALVEATKGVTKGYAEVIPGIKKVTFTITALGFPSVLYKVGDKVTYRVGTLENSNVVDAVIESINVDGPSDEAVSYTINLSSTGAYEKFIPIYRLDKLIDNNNNQFVTDTGDRLCVVTQTN